MKLNYSTWILFAIIATYHLIRLAGIIFIKKYGIKQYEGDKEFSEISLMFQLIHKERLYNAKFWLCSFVVYSIIHVLTLIF